MQKGVKTVGFMIIISIVFISILATVNELTQAKIEQNFQIERAKKILYAFGIFPGDMQQLALSATATTAAIPWKESDVLNIMKEQIRSVTVPIPGDLRDNIRGSFLEGQETVEIFEHVNEAGEVLAYGVPLFGKGLWGTIEGFGTLSKDLEKMVGIAFTQQFETPGLGARITEQEFKSYFRNLDLSGFYNADSVQRPIMMVKNKEQTNVENSTNTIQAITGATLTSRGVLNMVNSNLALYIKIIEAYKKQTGA
jgi:Na+-transporting NADH:ubiquinone oxidoreductase subunit C